VNATRSTGAGRRSFEPRAIPAEAPSEPVDALSGWETTYTDDVWPLELWLSHEDGFLEDGFLEGDTWHAGRGRRRQRRWFLFG